MRVCLAVRGNGGHAACSGVRQGDFHSHVGEKPVKSHPVTQPGISWSPFLSTHVLAATSCVRLHTGAQCAAYQSDQHCLLCHLVHQPHICVLSDWRLGPTRCACEFLHAGMWCAVHWRDQHCRLCYLAVDALRHPPQRGVRDWCRLLQGQWI